MKTSTLAPPRREEFLLDVRRAIRLEMNVASRSFLDGNGECKAAELPLTAAPWLTPKAVANYSADDFSSIDVETRTELDRAVDRFRKAASAVPGDQRPTKRQFVEGATSLRGLARAVRSVVLPEWIAAAEALIADCERWAADLDWRTRREPKELHETLLGRYELPQLLVFANLQLYVLVPIARFVPRAAGAFELQIQPSFHTETIYREFDGKWKVLLEEKTRANGSERRRWSRESFSRAIDDLRSLL